MLRWKSSEFKSSECDSEDLWPTGARIFCYKFLSKLSLAHIYIYIYIYVYVYFVSISSLIQISLNIIDILCLHIFFWIRSNSRITFIVFGGGGELIYVLSIVVCIPSTFCPTLGHHQGRIYYKSDVTFVLAYYYYVRAPLPLKIMAFAFKWVSIISVSKDI